MNNTMKDYDPIPNINRLLKAEEVAELLNISCSFAYLMMQSGQLPTVKWDGHVESGFRI